MTKKETCKVIKKWLDDHKWRHDFSAPRSLFKMGVALKCTIPSVRVIIDVRESFYLVYAILPITCYRCLDKMERFLSMANFGLINGNFEVDVRDGEIRYKTYVNLRGVSSLSTQIVEDSIICACLTVRKYADGIARICLSAESEALDINAEIKKCEPAQGLR